MFTFFINLIFTQFSFTLNFIFLYIFSYISRIIISNTLQNILFRLTYKQHIEYI